ncbi:MAG: prephenate dehydrogenase/arogenate dehydrogenase family protein, partial [Candidatus Bathycorpusculaceae bacterium]
MIAAIIGVGKMGKWFAKLFLKEGMHVVVSDKDKEKLLKTAAELDVEIADNVGAVQKADMILICVPIENFEEVIAEIGPHTRPKQRIMDICSVKENPINIMHKYITSGTVLGTHPLFGPGVKSIKNQKFVLTPTNSEEQRLAEEFKSWLEGKGAKVYIMSPRKHDKLMSLVIGLPYFLSLVVCDTLITYGNFLEAKEVSGTSYKFLLTLVEALMSEEAEFSADLQMSLPDVDKVEALFLEKVKEWLNLIKQRNKAVLVDKIKLLKDGLAKIDGKYSQSYERMHKIIELLG